MNDTLRRRNGLRLILPAICLFIMILPAFPTAAREAAPEPEKQAEKPWVFESAVARYEEEAKKDPPPEGCTLFVGSSTWTIWGKGVSKDFPDWKAVNRGFGGSTIPDLLRAMDRIILPCNPDRVLFFCGTNDLAGGTPPQRVFENFETFLQRLWEARPDAKVFYVPAAHAPSRERIWEKTDTYNGLVKKLAETEKRVIYVDTLSAMKNADGTTKEELYLNDRLHMNRAGYEVWIPILKSAVEAEQ